MAVYKVPQDVEADDKLIGPFSFRQFIYLLIAGGAIALAWGLSRVFLPLAVIPLPIIILFGALALPLRKDQPMEVYLAAVVSFHLKPRKRIWQPDGITSLVEVTAPKTIERQRTKGFDENEAERRLSYLAGIVDSQGWSVRGVVDQGVNSSLNSDVLIDAQRTEDVLDDDNEISKNFNQMITQADANRREEMIKKMYQPEVQHTQSPPNPGQYQAPGSLDQAEAEAEAQLDAAAANVRFNPYPNSMHQTVIQPLSASSPQQPPAPQALPELPQVPRPIQPAAQPGVYQVPAQPVAPTYQEQPPQTYQQPQPAPETFSLTDADEPSNERYVEQLYADTPPATQALTAPLPIPQPAPEPTPEPPSPGTIDLAINHHDLSVETIQREANRLKQKEKERQLEEEVVISLH